MPYTSHLRSMPCEQEYSFTKLKFRVFLQVPSSQKGLERNYQKDKAALERVQRKAARFVTGNYDRTTSVTEMLQDLQWDTLETMRRHARLSTIYKMCHGLLDGDWGDYLITSKERRTRGSHDFKFIVPKGHKDIFRFSFFPRTITEWNKLPEETVSSQSLCIFKSKLI